MMGVPGLTIYHVKSHLQVHIIMFFVLMLVLVWTVVSSCLHCLVPFSIMQKYRLAKYLPDSSSDGRWFSYSFFHVHEIVIKTTGEDTDRLLCFLNFCLKEKMLRRKIQQILKQQMVHRK